MIKLSKLFATFERFGYCNEILAVGNGIDLLITSRGGRLYGPFIDGYSAFDWMPSNFELNQCLQSGKWNIGGERIWLAPEYLFNFENHDRIIETYNVDSSYDPGFWILTKSTDAIILKMQSKIPMARGNGFIEINIERSIEAIKLEGQLAGWRQSIRVHEISETGLPFIPWLIRQVAPGGCAYFSSNMTDSGNPVFGKPVADAIWPREGYWDINFSGEDFYKVSYGRNSIGNGACGYYIPNGKNIIYRPTLNEFSAYPEMVCINSQEQKAQCAAVFYDSGRFGAYGEIELYGNRQGATGLLEVTCYLTSLDLKDNIKIA